MTRIIVLDSLFESLDTEREAARSRFATVERWDGDLCSLTEADVVAHVRTVVGAEMIAALPRCRVITRFGTGVDTVDLNAAAKAGIKVVTVRDYCVPELPSHTLALALALVRRLRETGATPDARWEDVAARAPLSRRVNATVIGLGSTGRRVASALAALGYAVVTVTEHGRDYASDLGARVVSLEQGLTTGDLVFLHVALDATTVELLDERRLAMMRQDAILVNTARLALMDEKAVAAALVGHRLGGLALDARLDPHSPLARFADDPRVLVTPHVGWYSRESAEVLRRAGISNALDALSATADVEVSPQ